MTILDEVRSWSRGLIDWQREAVARLDEKVALDAADHEDLYAILKARRGIDDPSGRAARGIPDAPVRPSSANASVVNLLSVAETRNVNALASKGHLTFAAEGLTVVYGGNGSGKSGYARVLKQACFARDKRERVLPNANLTANEAGIPSADLVGAVDGVETLFTWTDGDQEGTALHRIAVFDQSCARAFVDNEGNFAYEPAGLDILAGLGQVCTRFRVRLQQDIDGSAPNLEPLQGLAAKTNTAAGRLAAALPAGVSEAQIIGLAGLNEKEAEHLESIVRALAAPDPATQAAALRNQALRLKALADAIGRASAVITVEKATQLQALVTASNEAKTAAELATRVFNEIPGQLPGTGGDAWRAMFEAARAFAVTSEPVKAFPLLQTGSSCPLCQQDLDQRAADRLVEFDRFIQGETQRRADAARDAAAQAFKHLRDTSVEFGLTHAMLGELKAISEGLFNHCSTFQENLKERQKEIVSACSPKGDWEAARPIGQSPVESLSHVITDLDQRAAAMDAAADENQKKTLEAERAELETRRQFGDLKAVAIEAIEKYAHQKKLQACLADIATHAITRKASDLTNTMGTQLLADALNQELAVLNIANLSVTMKAVGERGRTTFKLILERLGGQAASDVLSEGEQRAVAIASFLTERTLSGDGSGVIFDDPVCSLDHRRRQRVARRLAHEAATRQVVVFTHDMFFLFALMDEADQLRVPVAARSVSRTQDGFGVAADELPFDGASTKARVGWLRDKQQACAKLHRQSEEAAYAELVGRIYTKLREAWEGGVEEVLLNRTVERFRKSVETNRLLKVQITDADINTVVDNMTRCSNYAHNAARDADVEMPTPEEVARDIQVLDDWRKGLEDRKSKRN